MKEQYQIATTNKIEKRATIAALLAIGYRWSNETCSTVEFVTNRLEDYPVIVVFPYDKTLSGNLAIRDNGGMVITLSDFLKLEEKIEIIIEVVLNDKYTAEVSKKGIKVGCTTFPLSVMKKLLKACDEIEDKTS
jgi:hypothetical protein